MRLPIIRGVQRLRVGLPIAVGGAMLAVSVGLSLAPAASAGSIKYGGTVYVESNDQGPSPRNFNPYAVAGSGVQLGTVGDIYEPLLMYNTIGGGPPHPWLATAYRWSNGNRLLTFTIRKGVTWTDGKPFTAADVAFTFNELKKFPTMDTIGFDSHVTKVTVSGDTVSLTFKQPDVPLLFSIASLPIIPQHIWAKVKNPVKFLNPNPVGTGPFELTSFTAANYVLSRNPHYWQAGKPYVSKLVMSAYTVTAVENDLSKGLITWADAYSPTLKKSYVAWDPKDNHYWFPPEGEVALFPNDGKPPFNNMYVRQAISYAVNRQTIDNIGETTFEPPANATGIILPNQKAWLSPSVAKKYSYAYSPAKALQLLAKAGWHKNSQGKLVNASGQQMTITMNVPAGWPDFILDEQIMTQEFKALGIDASSVQQAYNTYVSDMATGNFELDMWFTGFGPTPYFNYNGVLNSAFTAPEGKAAADDYERWNQAATDRLLNAFTLTSNPAQEKSIIDQLQGVMAKYQPIIPLVYAADWDEYRTNQFVGWPTPQDPYANPAPADVPYNEPVVLNIHLK
jgi:peptide/nickel transport system substrate-binding protein